MAIVFLEKRLTFWLIKPDRSNEVNLEIT